MVHDHGMQNAHYIPIHRVIAKSLLSTCLLTVSPSASKTKGLPW